jgi:hypothetical protein
MKTKIVLLFLLGWVGIAFGQDQKSFKERNKIIIDHDIYAVEKNKIDSIVYKNIKYDKEGVIISMEKDTLKKKSVGKQFVKISIKETGLESGDIISANLKVVNKKIMIYPWIFKKQKGMDTITNKFFDKHDVYIQMKDRVNYTFPYYSWQVGVITLPIKWYLKSQIENVGTNLNAMINVGHKWGRTKFVKFPHEEKSREYKTGFSINGLAGISKIELNKRNTPEDKPIEGNIAAFSLGGALGFHYSDFTIMIATGFDLPTSNKKDWNFTGTPWVGIGIGYNFLKFN